MESEPDNPLPSLNNTATNNSAISPLTQPEAKKPPSIKELQEKALESLPMRRLYAALYIRQDPPVERDFHWAFYYHTSARGGKKYHIRNLGDGWIPEHLPNGCIFKDQFLCMLIEVGWIPQAREPVLDQVMKEYDENCNNMPGMTCRIWFLLVLKQLAASMLLRCSERDLFQDECFAIGKAHMHSAARNEQPRPVLTATRCGSWC